MLLFGLALRDIVLVSVSVLGYLYILTSYRSLTRSLKRLDEARVYPRSLSLTVLAGQEASEVLEIYSPVMLEIDLDVDYVQVEPKTLLSGYNVVKLFYAPVIGGYKVIDKVPISVSVGLFSSKTSLSVYFELHSIPRVYPVAARALATLAEMGTGTTGPQITRLRGAGLEYAESRDYQPGDPLKFFDWKAYAKTLRPMVKDYYREGAGGTGVLFDNAADNPVSLDELNHAFLQLVTSLVEVEENIKIHLLNKREVYSLNRFNTLLLSIKLALEGHVQEFREYYSLIEPRAHRVAFFQQILQEKIQATERGFTGEHSASIIISSLTGDPRIIHETIEENNSQDVFLLFPTKPWLWQTSLQKTNKVYNTCLKNLDRLQRQGIQIHHTPEKILYRLQRTTGYAM